MRDCFGASVEEITFHSLKVRYSRPQISEVSRFRESSIDCFSMNFWLQASLEPP